MRHRWLRVAALLSTTLAGVLACSSFGSVEGPPPDTEDASPEDVAAGDRVDEPVEDAGTDGPPFVPCNQNKAFGLPSVVAGLDQENHYSVHLSSDELRAYVSINPAVIALRARGATSGTFLGVVDSGMFATVNTAGGAEQFARLSDDERSMVFQRGINGIFSTTRANASAPFGTPTLLVGGGAYEPYVVPGVVYYRTGGEIFRRPIGAGSPQSVYSAVGGETILAPVVSRDERTMYFASNRQADGGLGSTAHVWRATRPSTTSVFDAVGATWIAELSSNGFDEPMWLSPDNCRLYFRSSRVADPSYWIYVATRTP
jgi:hypothetical protein